MSVDVGTAIGYLDLDTSKFKQGFKSALGDLKTFSDRTAAAGDRFTALGSAMTTTGSALTKYVTTPLVGIGTAAFAVGNKFESAMSRVQAISGATGDELEALTEQAMDLGATTSFSASEAAAGMENLASAGFTVTEIMSAMPGLLNLAASSGADLATASEIAASAVRGFGLEASETAHVADVFAEAAARTNAQTEDMGEAMKYVAPVANAMGISLEETAAAIGIMSDAGIKGSQAGTALRGALSRLASPTDKARAAIESLGMTFYDASGNMLPLQGIVEQLETGMSGLTQEQRNQALITIFGQEALSGMLTLMERGSGELGSLTEGFENVSGSAQEMADIMMDNTSGAIEEMFGALETAAINVQQILAPVVTSVVQWITSLINSFNQLPDGAQTMIVTILGLVAALGPFLLILGKVTSSVGGLLTAFKGVKGMGAIVKTALGVVTGGFGPVLAMIAAVVAAVIALKLAWDNNFGGIREKTAEIGQSLQELFSNLLSLLQSFGEFFRSLWENNWAGLRTSTEAVFAVLENAFSTFLDVINNLVQLFSNVFAGNWSAAWGNIKAILSGVLSILGGLLKAGLGLLVSILAGIGAELLEAAITAFNFIQDGFSQVWESIRAWLELAKEDPVTAIESIGTALYDAGSSVINSFLDGLKFAWESVVSWAKEVANWLVDLLNPEINIPTGGGSGGSFASGLDYVPRDMIVKVHEGESIRTKQQTREDAANGRGGDTFNFYSPEPIDEIEAAKQMKRAKRELAEGF